MNLRTVAIVGAGLAASRAAETLRAEGFRGRLVMIGEEPCAPYERPALSKEFLAGKRDDESLLLRPASFWGDREVELLLGHRVVQAHPATRRLLTDRGFELSFDGLVLTTGARPRRLPLTPLDGVHELRTLADARALRRELTAGAKLVVIGAGFVGAEVASTATSLGVSVTIVEAASTPLTRMLGCQVGQTLADRWREHGVDVLVGVGVSDVGAGVAGRVGSVLLTDGRRVPADAVLVGVGVQPARELLPPIPVRHFVAAGDVVGPGHWSAASLDGAAAARRLLGLAPPAPQPSYVWSDQFGLRLQLVGTPGSDDEAELDGRGDSFAVRYRARDGRLTAALLANQPSEAAAIRRSFLEESLVLSA